MSNNTSVYEKLKERVVALNKESANAGDEWIDKLEQLKADIFASSLPQDEKDELYNLLGLTNSQNSNGHSYVASQRKSRRSRRARKTRKARKTKKTRKQRRNV